MNFSTKGISKDEAHSFLTGTIAPRPVAWISTISADAPSCLNLAPFSSLVPVCNKPPLLLFSCGRKSDGTRKDTATNILETGEFVVNMVDESLLENVAQSANEHASLVDEFTVAGVTPIPSHEVRPPMVGEALVSLECVLHSWMELGDDDAKADVMIGRLVHASGVSAAFAPPQGPDQPIERIPIGALWVDWYLTAGVARFVPQPPMR